MSFGGWLVQERALHQDFLYLRLYGHLFPKQDAITIMSCGSISLLLLRLTCFGHGGRLGIYNYYTQSLLLLLSFLAP